MLLSFFVAIYQGPRVSSRFSKCVWCAQDEAGAGFDVSVHQRQVLIHEPDQAGVPVIRVPEVLVEVDIPVPPICGRPKMGSVAAASLSFVSGAPFTAMIPPTRTSNFLKPFDDSIDDHVEAIRDAVHALAKLPSDLQDFIHTNVHVLILGQDR
jgi:hypothetical protein